MDTFIRFEKDGQLYFGKKEDDSVRVLESPYWVEVKETGTVYALDSVRVVCPVQPTKIICVGLNYHKHVSHSQSAVEAPKNPMLFMKPPSSLIGPGEEIIYPDNCDRVDYEAELAVVMGKRCRKIAPEQVAEHIFGYTCLNDVTARHIQKADGQWTRGKGFDTFCPIGPHIVTGIDVSDVSVEAYLNGKKKQSGRTSEMIFPISELISFITSAMTLEPGDVISTGTPEGIDPMQMGDTIEVRVEKIGSLVNTVA